MSIFLARTSGTGQWLDILLRHPSHIQDYTTKGDSGIPQVQTSGDVSMLRIPIRRSHPRSGNLIQDTGTVLVANGQ